MLWGGDMAQEERKTSGGPRIVVAGAGSIGCFVGGLLARGVQDVTLLVRPYMLEEISKQGILLTDFSGLDEALPPDAVNLVTKPEALSEADIILVTVKSGATSVVAEQIASFARKDAVVVSLQNGTQNAGLLRERLAGWDVRAGMVPFNVVAMGGGRFHRGTSGDILIEKGAGHIARKLSVRDLDVHEVKRMAPVQWGKLLINLNNALNALSDLPLRKQIMDMRWRRLMADQMKEALAVLEAASLETTNPVTASVPMRTVPKILRLPTWAFRWVAKAMLAIDPTARSSMWEDLSKGRKTEIDELQGVIVQLAHKHGIPAPINERVIELVRNAEDAGEGSPALTAAQVRNG
ncbi:ketopantoate reductase [Shimia isoporae]|uniref:2-dehydropantoate 2-reductase n=1 Tax=Shimia isoporae TaxID=647720 RepID=A0A4R1NTY1_9RHOB|nr:2-dehydropantoate 2-reductase [Shimia isoporae]TCL08472.1 ketopantoate reductase [Shimia isoporae]